MYLNCNYFWVFKIAFISLASVPLITQMVWVFILKQGLLYAMGLEKIEMPLSEEDIIITPLTKEELQRIWDSRSSELGVIGHIGYDK